MTDLLDAAGALLDDTMVQMTAALTAPYNYPEPKLFADLVGPDLG